MAYKAVQFEASSPQEEMIGVVILSFVDNLRKHETEPLLKQYELDNIDTEKWYPYQVLADLVREISKKSDGSAQLVAVGKAVAQYAPLPPELDTPEKLVPMLPAIYSSGLRNTHPEEGYIMTKINDTDYHLRNNSPTANDLLFGFFWELMARVTPEGTDFLVEPIADYPDDVKGSTFRIAWGDSAHE